MQRSAPARPAAFGIVQRALENGDALAASCRRTNWIPASKLSAVARSVPEVILCQGLLEQRAGSFGVTRAAMVIGPRGFGVRAGRRRDRLRVRPTRPQRQVRPGPAASSAAISRVRSVSGPRWTPQAPYASLSAQAASPSAPASGASRGAQPDSRRCKRFGPAGMGESHQIAINHDDALGFCLSPSNLDGDAGDLSE